MSKNESKVKSDKPPFKLCFRQKTALGRSNILPSRPPGYIHYVTKKFHVKDDFECGQDVLEKSRSLYDRGPEEKYNKGILESHVYGWYNDVKFRTPEDEKSKLLNFPRSMNPVFRHSDR